MPIDIASGTVQLPYDDLRVPGKVELVWDRSYSTALIEQPSSCWGPGWVNRFMATLTRHAGGFEFRGADGAVSLLVDREGAVEAGHVVAGLRDYVEVFLHDGRYVVQTWGVDSPDVWRHVFQLRADRSLQLAAIETPTGHGIDLQWQGDRLVGVVQRHEGRALLLDYGDHGRLVAVTLRGADGSEHAVAQYAYDEAGRLCAVSDAMGREQQYAYDTAGRIIREAAADGAVTLYRYDASGRCVRKAGLGGYDEKRLRFLDAIRITEVTDSRGAVTRHQWLPSGQIVQAWNASGGLTRTSYDDHGRIASVIDPLGGETRYEYDDQGNRCRITNALGHVFALRFNDHHQPLELIDPTGQPWRREYDEKFEVVASIDPNGGRWQIGHDAQGNAVRLTNPKGDSRLCEFVDNVLVAATDWAGHRTQLRYDAFGRLVERVDPLGHAWRYRYDPCGQLIEVIQPNGGVVRAEYAPGGEVTRQVDEEGRILVRRYGPCQRLLQAIDPLGRKVSYEWGTEPGELLAVVNELEERHEFTYDEAGRCTAEVGFDGRRMEYRYDVADRLVSTTNGVGEKVVYQRDPLGAVAAMHLPDGDVLRYAYDPMGRLLAASGAGGEVGFKRNAAGELVAESQDHHWVRYALDPLGNTTRLTTDVGLDVQYQVDANSLWRSLACAEGRFEFRHDPRGLQVERILDGATRLQRQFGPTGQLAAQLVSRSGNGLDTGSLTSGGTGGAALIARRFTFDLSGLLRTTEDLRTGRTDFIVDPAERLTEVRRPDGTTERYRYDDAGNLVAREVPSLQGTVEQLTYGPGNELTSRGDCVYEHDGAGRLVRKIEGATGPQPRVWRYEWNALDQLKRLVRPDGEVWEYHYDPFGRRTRKVGPNCSERTLWSGHVALQRITTAGGARTVRTWLYAQASFEPMAVLADGQAMQIVPDHLGTPRELLDREGRVIWQSVMEAHGERATASAPELDHALPQAFAGQHVDPESGLHYNRFRYYDPQCARFISQDPIRLAGGLNLHAYAPNPIGWIDPWGLLCQRLKDSLPEGPGIYHIELNGKYYTGSGVNVKSRLSSSDHPAAKMLNDPNVKVTVYPVNLGKAKDNPRMSNHILRGYEQGVMDAKQNTPRVGGSQNDIRAAKATRTGEYAQDAKNNQASMGAPVPHEPPPPT